MSFNKEAFWSRLAAGVSTALKQPKVQGQLAVGAVVGAVGLGQLAIGRIQENHSYNQMLDLYPELKRENPERVKLYFDTIRSSAPGIAKQPLVAGSVVKRLVNFDGFDHAVYKDLLSAQSVINGNAGHFGEQLMGLNKTLNSLVPTSGP